MINNYKWVAYFDFNKPEHGVPLFLAAFASFVATMVLLVCWTAVTLLCILPIAVAWAIFGMLFLTNSWWKLGDRSDKAQGLYNYLFLPQELKSQLPKMDYHVMKDFSEEEAREYRANIERLQNAYDAQQKIVNAPRIQQHFDESKILIEHYEQVNKQLG